jgi:thimet oligopeptidase
VIPRDLLTPFHLKGNRTDPGLARRYVDEILAPGGSRPAKESIQAFLGRPYNLKAFEEWVRESETEGNSRTSRNLSNSPPK